MLLMVPPATATVSGDSFSSAESNFRQLDDVFLQTQTRIWLGEVLRTRFDEQLGISDLLSDGELLSDVSKILWNMLLVKFMEPRHVKTHTQISNDSRKRRGRYMPYSNVDSFLKICKVFGLDGIDLFSPSDVVEKRDTRKVCICIRSLSKKARSKQLNVPDFDIVTYTVAMPTNIVGCIRKSLELSQQLAFSDPTAFHTNTNYPIQLDEYSVSSSCMDNESYGSNSTPDTSRYDDSSNYLADNSDDVEVSSKMSMNSLLSGRVLQFDFDVKRDEDDPRTTNLFRTEFPYYEAESTENGMTELRKVQEVANYESPSRCTILDTEESHIGLELGSCDLSVESHLPYWHEKSLHSSMCRGVELVDNRVDPTLRDSVDNALWVKITNVEGEVRNDDKAVMCARWVDSDREDCSNNDGDKRSKYSNCTCNSCAVEDRCPSTFQPQCTTSQDVGKEYCTRTLVTGILPNQHEYCMPTFQEEDATQMHLCLINKGSDDVARASHQDSSRDILLSHAHQTNEDERNDWNIDVLEEERSDRKHDKRVVEKQNKGNLMGPLLKTVAKGAAFIGVVFLLHLRIRNDRERKGKGGEQSNKEKKDEGDENSNKDEGGNKSSKEEKDEGGEQSSPVQKSNVQELSSRKGIRGSSEVYPAEKLKLGG